MGSASQTLRRLAFFALRLHAVQLKELWLLSCCCQEGLFASACQEGLALPRAAAKKSFATCQQQPASTANFAACCNEQARPLQPT